MTDTARALWYTAPRAAELRPNPLPPLHAGWVEVETCASALSRGTERLVWEGRVPSGEHSRMRAPFQQGDFPFPVKYGYAAVGRVVAGDARLIGRTVFALHPHQDRIRLPASSVLPVPEGVPPGRAVLAANMETALNAIWDAAPALAPGARVAVIGMGLLGLLVMALLSRREDLEVTACDILPEREALAAEFGVKFRNPGELVPDHDLVFHTSATAAGLAAGLGALRFEGTLIELSWYGDAAVPAPLGGAFHSQRLTIRSSQVGHVAPTRRVRVTHRERLSRALALLDDPRVDAFVTGEVTFEALPGALAGLLAPGAAGIATRVAYGREAV
ncbi:zinc-binding alcohol dehydrogenase [Limibaculum sp. FT325]|uniref:zinc-dependent alcohol dehydrogenase n=1 Tax=Thermohalobaculum sediminis TaxID=2939436 RepID=UPI0020BEA45D|nr:zinc-binding alcohol dehydrogenase [Limibaculum sediminis]MCL5779173.1 zinc-binding alcohol dehydrogenase [Limibaculum sediminis]